jgi:hypothetical protein
MYGSPQQQQVAEMGCGGRHGIHESQHKVLASASSSVTQSPFNKRFLALDGCLVAILFCVQDGLQPVSPTYRTVMRRRWRQWDLVWETTAFAVAA